MEAITIVLDDSCSMRRALECLARIARKERDYFDGNGGAHGATAEALEKIAIAVEKALEPAHPFHYPPGMGKESRRLHREYNRLVKAQLNGAKNAAEVIKLTDECATKGIILIPGGENL